MTTETVQDVLRDMRRIAAIQPQEFADRIERALAGSEAVAEMVIDKYGCTLIGLQARGNLPDGKYSLYTTPHPAIGNKPAVDDAMVERACGVVAKHAGEDWCAISEFAKNTVREVQRDALTAAIIDSAQDGKGE